MNVVMTATTGVVNKDTIFRFNQQDNVVFAQYEGGGILRGHLVGNLNGSKLQFRYCQIDENNNLDGGISDCDLLRMPDGRIRMIEKFQWESRKDVGENIFEEIA